MNIGVLALQGAFREHIAMVRTCGADTSEIRLPEQLGDCDGLIIPGGESTTIAKLIIEYAFTGAIETFARSGRPIFGTCAGAILMASRIEGNRNSLFNLIDIDISRNAYGRQVDSREAAVEITTSHSFTFNAVFIRAPVIRDTGTAVTVLSHYRERAIMACQDNMLVATFHPELSGDSRIHQYFLDMVRSA